VALGSPASRLGSDELVSDALSIADLYGRIDRALRGALPGQLWVSGEVRSFKVSARGHCYIELGDPADRSASAPVLKVVCWSSRWSKVCALLDQLGIVLDAGMVVRVKGEVQLYKARGDISFILSELDTEALLGKVAAERARLVKALVDEDLFDRNRRLPVPHPALNIGLVASPGTEGFRDFMGSLESSGMAFAVRLVPTHVQGRRASASVASAIRRLSGESIDIMVVVRGGGSKADLATFDAESVARAIAGADIPVWTGIGHTGDLSVADEIANRAFITPTECGQELARAVTAFWQSRLEAGLVVGRLARQQMASADRLLERHRHSTITCARTQLERHGDRLIHRSYALRAAARGHLDAHDRRVRQRVEDLVKTSRRSVIGDQERMGERTRRLAVLSDRRLEVETQRIGHWRRLLGAYDYRRQLERGYSVTRDAMGTVVRSTRQVEPGALLFTHVSDGEMVSTVADPVAPDATDTRTEEQRRSKVTEDDGDEGNP
jgi:exodeoxyribonuclease VII large subunit